MPILRKLASKLGLQRKDSSNDQPLQHGVRDEPSKRGRGRLQKRTSSPLGVVLDLPEPPEEDIDQGRVRNFRANTLTEFDEELIRSSVLRSQLRSVRSGHALQSPSIADSVPGTRAGSQRSVQTSSVVREEQLQISVSDGRARSSPPRRIPGTSIGRYGLPVHPENLEPPGPRHRPRATGVHQDPYSEASGTIRDWALAVSSAVQEGRAPPEAAIAGEIAVSNLIINTASTNSVIVEDHSNFYDAFEEGVAGYLDWVTLSDADADAVAKNVSPHDSAIVLPEGSSQTYSGKGKGRDTSDKAVANGQRSRRSLIDGFSLSVAQIEQNERELADEVAALNLQIEQLRAQREQGLLIESRAPPATKECAVCGDEKDSLDYPAKPATAQCEHLVHTCQQCLESWMESEFETKGCEGIRCPECPEAMQYNDVQLAASAKIFAAYDKSSMLAALGGLAEFAWCLNAKCGSGQLNIENSKFMDCANCGYKQCLRHRVKWHASETCDAYDYRTSGQQARDEELKTETMLDAMSKKCPGPRCGWRIEKIEGCDHMTCRKCRFEFCWQCLASQKEIQRIGNTAHSADCKFHSRNLDIAWPFSAHIIR